MISIRNSMERSFQTIEALKKKQGVTAYELADIFGLTSQCHTRRDTAMRWIDMAGYYYPVAEIGSRRRVEANRGPESTVYGILKD